MEFKVEKREVTSVGDISTKRISISSNAKAFRMIIGQVYPDIIKAVVREVFTNAWDSQKVANNLDTPIEIHAPSVYEPWFSIRDFGVSMSADVVDNVWSNIFESTKDKSNDEAGMYGMGSKSPLGYTDSFTMACYLNGVARFYEIYLDETGSPVISLKFVSETEEPNGVLVQIPVAEKDIAHFNNMIQHFAFGAHTPIQIDGKKFTETYEVKFEKDNWQIVNHSSIKKAHVRMGCVLYAINSDMLCRNDYFRDVKIQSFFNEPIIFDFPIGTFEVTASREDIRYDEDVIKRLTSLVDETIQSVTEMLNDKIKKCRTMLEAREIYSKPGFTAQLIDMTSLQWRGYKLNRGRNKESHHFHDIQIGEPKGKIAYRFSKVLDIQDNYGSVLVIQKPDLKKANQRFRTFMNNRFNNDYRNSKIYWIIAKDFNIFSMKKLTTFLNVKSVVFLDRFEPHKEVRQKKEYVYKVRDLSYDGTMGSYIDEFDDSYSNFYVPAFRSSLEYETYVVESAIKFFFPKKMNKKVAVVFKSEMKVVEDFGLKDIVECHRQCVEKMNFNEDEITKYIVENYMKKEFPVKMNDIIPEFKYNKDNVKKDIAIHFHHFSDEFKLTIREKITNMEISIEKYSELPIIKFVDTWKIRNHMVEYMGAVKKEIERINNDSV